jgi:hypothetical protein
MNMAGLRRGNPVATTTMDFFTGDIHKDLQVIDEKMPGR